MTNKELEEIKARCDAATKGPWIPTKDDSAYELKNVWSWTGIGYNPDGATAWETDAGCGGYGLSKADATFCAHARTDIPALIEEVEKARARVHLLETTTCIGCQRDDGKLALLQEVARTAGKVSYCVEITEHSVKQIMELRNALKAAKEGGAI